MRLTIYVALAATIAELLAGGCARKESGVAKIGSVGPMTGDQAKLGADEANAVMLAVKEANAAGEVMPGVRLEVSILDDQHDPGQAVSAAKKLAADADVMAVVGHVNSSCSKPASAIYNEAGLVQITPSSTNPEISRLGHRTFFRTCATDDIQGPAGASYAIKELGVRKIYIIDDKTTYGKGIADEFEARARELGAEVLGHDGLTQGDKDFTPLLTKIGTSQPDLIYFGGMYPEGALLVKQARGLGIKAVFMGGDGINPENFVELAAGDAEGTFCTAIGADLELLPGAKKFLDAYRAKYGEPGIYSAHSYDAARIIIEAIRRAGKKDRAAVLENVRTTRAFPGILGPTEFDQNGDTTNRVISIYKVTEGRYKYLGAAF